MKKLYFWGFSIIFTLLQYQLSNLLIENISKKNHTILTDGIYWSNYKIHIY